MHDEVDSVDLNRYLGLVLVATLAVTVAPVALVTWIESQAPLNPFVAVALGIALSLASWSAGVFSWSRLGSNDLVFADLMIWGWLRRKRTELRIERLSNRLGLTRLQEEAEGASRLDPREQLELVSGLAAVLEQRDPYTYRHTKRVTRHTYMIAKAMGLPAAEVERIRIAASLHDVGKLYVPFSILGKRGRLTEAEFELVKEHTLRGAEVVAGIGEDVAAMVRHHHERVDGRGYPHNLAGSEIPLGARIIAVADTFDAITSNRSYRSRCKHRLAIEVLRQEAGTQLDPDVVSAFNSYYSGRGSVEWWMVLTTAPQRLVEWAVSWVGRILSAGVARGAAAAGAALLIGNAVHAPWAVPSETRVEASASQPNLVSSSVATSADAGGASGSPVAGSERSTSGAAVGTDSIRPKKSGQAPSGGKPSSGGDFGSSTPGAGDGGTKDGIGGAVADVSGGAGQAAGGVVTGAGSAVGGAVEGSTGAVAGVIEDSGGAVGGVVSGAGDSVGGAVDDVGNAAGAVVEDTTGAVADTVDSVGGAAGAAVEDVTGTVGGVTGGLP